jgi:hypothetical protein
VLQTGGQLEIVSGSMPRFAAMWSRINHQPFGGLLIRLKRFPRAFLLREPSQDFEVGVNALGERDKLVVLGGFAKRTRESEVGEGCGGRSRL